MPRLVSLNVGLPREIVWQGRTVRTAIWKEPVQGRRMARRLNIDGDGQGDLAGHGGEHRAVFVYQIDSYRHWEDHLGRADFVPGQFGENFTVDGLPDDEVRIGDRYQVGGALFEVSQPRVTCYRVGIRMNEPQMPALLVSHDRPGFYFRVLEEGEVGAGDEIVRVAEGPAGMTVAGTNALLYKPAHPQDKLEQALRAPALSAGWRRSFEALLEQGRKPGATAGNAGLRGSAMTKPAWDGFRALKVTDKVRETGAVTSLRLESRDGQSLPEGAPGQFIVLRLLPAHDRPALLRSYSLSGGPGEASYRVSVKREAGGMAGAYVADEVRPGDVIEASAPRGAFTLQTNGDAPIVLLSAGIGATPVLAMLLALAAAKSPRQVWWLYGARNRSEHPFLEEARKALEALPNARSHICYSAPEPGDRPGVDFDARGRLSVAALGRLGAPPDADFYLCGPQGFLADFSTGLAGFAGSKSRIYAETFGATASLTPGVVASLPKAPHPLAGPAGAGPLVSFARSGLSVRWRPPFQSLLELAEACDVPVRWACRSGVCHTCETGLVAGSVVYRPDPIEPPAAGDLLICCSAPQGDVSLDL